MRRLDTIRRAGRSLGHAKTRTLLTSLAIGVGAFTLTLSLAAGQGSREYADKLIGSNVNPQALFIVKDKSVFERGESATGLKEYNPDATNVDGNVIKQLTQKDIDMLNARKDLEKVQPLYQLSIQYFTFEGSTKKYTSEVTTYDPTVLSETSAGNLPKLGTMIGENDVILPESFAETLKKPKESLIGKKITLNVTKPAAPPTEDEINTIIATQGIIGLKSLSQQETKQIELTVRAFTKKSSFALTASAGLQIADNQAKTIAEYTTKGTSSYQKYTAVTALAKTGFVPEDVKMSLTKAGYAPQTAKDLQNLLFTIVNILQGIVIGFAIIALIASVFGIINTQYISVLERTQQIGLMKALGMSKREVARLFRYEAAWIGFLGGVIGSSGAWALGTSLNPWISKQLNLGDGNYILVFNWMPVALLILGLMFVAVVAGYLPARKAARLDPIEALRTE
jgi:putative ABC transport system permease protein